MKTLVQSLRLLLVLGVLTGVVYPLACTGLALAVFPRQAGGSLVASAGRPVGSRLVAQAMRDPRYFWPRPSAANYATLPSGASNQGPTSAALKRAVASRRAELGPDAPEEMLTCSGSGLDPDISPAAAKWQARRIAAARGLPPEKLESLVDRLAAGRQFGLLGEPRVNVLALNLALDGTE